MLNTILFTGASAFLFGTETGSTDLVFGYDDCTQFSKPDINNCGLQKTYECSGMSDVKGCQQLCDATADCDYYSVISTSSGNCSCLMKSQTLMEKALTVRSDNPYGDSNACNGGIFNAGKELYTCEPTSVCVYKQSNKVTYAKDKSSLDTLMGELNDACAPLTEPVKRDLVYGMESCMNATDSIDSCGAQQEDSDCTTEEEGSEACANWCKKDERCSFYGITFNKPMNKCTCVLKSKSLVINAAASTEQSPIAGACNHNIFLANGMTFEMCDSKKTCVYSATIPNENLVKSTYAMNGGLWDEVDQVCQ